MITGPSGSTAWICASGYCYDGSNVSVTTTSAVTVGTLGPSCAANAYSVTRQERYGNGWDGGGTITLYANGVLIGTYGCTCTSAGCTQVSSFTLPSSVVNSGCNIGLESSPNFIAASGCTDGRVNLGPGAYYDVALAANTYYDFSWANNSGGTTGGFCASVTGSTGATSTSFSSAQSGWYSGSTASTLRVSANRNCSSWNNTSATLTYRHSAPTLGTPSNAGPINFCSSAGDFATAVSVSGSSRGSVVWDWGSNNGVWNNNWVNTTSGTSYFPKKTSNSDGNADRMRYRVTNNGCDVTSSTILIVNKFNEAPGTLTSSSTALCSTTGGNITLTATFPASINKNGSVAFYSGSCGGTLLGTVTAGDNTSTAQYVIPAPTSTTTYYARYEPGTGASCSNSTCVSVTVNVGTPSTAPTAISGSGVTVCHGNTVSLSPTGGALGAGASYEWFSGSCGGTAVGTGNSISVSPTGTTTYYVRAGAGTYCPATACASGTITLPAAGTGLATGGQSATCNVSGSNWIHFYHSSGNLIASINPNGNNLGSVTATAFVSGGAQLTQACGTGSNPSFTTAALGRSWLITPTNNLPASVRFPFSSAELSSLITASAGTTSNSLDNVAAIGDIKMSHYSGPANLNGSWSDNCVSAGGSGGTQLIGSQAGNGAVTTANGFPATVSASSYIQFNTPGFSEFWLHGNGGSSPLPVQLTSFSATCMESGKADIHWSTASEQNSQKFIIERSRDLSQWTQAGEQAAAGNSNYAIDYVAEDLNPFGGISYYRLVQVDNDGAERIYGPVSVSCGEKQNSMSVFPNPNKGAFTVEVTSDENVGMAEVQMVDLTGKVIAGKPVTIYEGQNQILFDDIELQQGTYIVRMISKNDIKPVRVVVN